ncbi:MULTISPECIES: cellulase family glycosylhydrolase [unclassified Roseitalea]|uniref:glycoside hydrolase family 5 protein n=1 Tax=unclassified Roseitalea TaxID=2639107 RepID=UPI00273E4D92|nr:MULTISPECIES: cellulase family glycosylhydrolase [unclassified Roseitalea]
MAGRAALAAAMFLALMAAPALPATFTPERGISMNLWVTWPDSARWNDPAVVETFPEWRAHVSQGDLDRLRQAGFDTLRLPVEPGFLMHDESPLRLATILGGLDRAIGMAVGAGLGVIVDMHPIPRGDESGIAGTGQLLREDALFDRYASLLARLAARLERWPADTVALEVMNEPTLDCYDRREQARWADRLERLHRAARAANDAITLIVSGACWGSADGLAAMDPDRLADDNTLWSFHSYEPFIVTHQGATWGGDIVAHLRDIPWPPTELGPADVAALLAANEARITDALDGRRARRAIGFLRDNARRLNELDDPAEAILQPFQTAAAWADRHDIARERIFLGEFGMIGREWGTDLDVPAQYRLNYMRAMIGQAEAHGFGWSVWSYGGAFGLVQGYDGRPLAEPLYDRLIWTLTD